MNGAADITLVLGAEVAGDQNAAAHTEAVENRDQQEAEGACGADRSQCLLAGITADNHTVGGVKEHLHKVGQHQGHGKYPDVFQQRAVQHIDGLCFLFGHKDPSNCFFR